MRKIETLGDQVRKIADQLKEESNLQIKATSRILASAAQISENHDYLINEVVDIVNEDLEKSSAYQQESYTVQILKNQFGTLEKAKVHLGIKANSWVNLTSKLNALPFNQYIITNDSKISILERLESIEKEVKTIHIEVSNILSLLTKLSK